MNASPQTKTPPPWLPREHRFAKLALLLVVGWIVVAYALLPTIWRHFDSAPTLAGRAMVTRTSAGIAGDPINLAFGGTEKDVVCAFHAAGWLSANAVTLASSIRIIGSVALDRPDPAAPVSPLYYEGRAEDLAFEKPVGRSADQRHHVRLWRAPDGQDKTEPAWLGAGTFDRSVGFSRYTLQITHHIAPDIDAERDFILADLSRVGAITELSEVSGVGPTMNGRNGGGDRYFTDGEIAVATLSGTCAPGPPAAPVVTSPPLIVRAKDALWRALRPWM